MRRQTLLITILLGSLCCPSCPLPAQETAPATPAGPRQDVEDYYKGLTARLEDLTADNESLRKQITRLREDFQKLAEEVARAGDRSKDAATAESLKQLKNAIEEVDSKRLADQKLVLAEFKELRAMIEKGLGSKSPPPLPPSRTPPPPKTNDNPPARRENGSYYPIREGDTLLGIVAALKKQGIKISAKQISDANPGVNWNRLKVNQQIFIPITVPQ